MKTKFGSANLNNDGYYRISSRKEGNNGKLLHRLIYEDFWGISLPSEISIHHKDGNKINNCILNLVAVPLERHSHIHNIGRTVSEETCRKISENHADVAGGNNPFYGCNHSKETRRKMSLSQNTTGYFRVSKHKKKGYTQGFYWEYSYYEEGKRKSITSVSLDKLKEKVLAKCLEWIEFDKEDSDGIGD